MKHTENQNRDSNDAITAEHPSRTTSESFELDEIEKLLSSISLMVFLLMVVNKIGKYTSFSFHIAL